MITIDTNIWAYYFDRDAPEHRKVVPHVERALKSDSVLVNTVMVMELAHFLVKNLGAVAAKEKLDVFLSYPLRLVSLDGAGMSAAVEELLRYSHLGIGGRDATILAAMRQEKGKRIMTHDGAFRGIEWVEVVDPVGHADRAAP